MKPWDAKNILYIKLGRTAKWWQDCKDQNIIKLGYNTGREDMNEWARSEQWGEIYKYQIANGKIPGSATNITRQIKEFYTDDGKTLWITFEENCLYYAFTDGEKPIPNQSENSSSRRLTAEGWKNVDIKGNELRMEDLSGNLTQTAAYQGTISQLEKDREDYLRRRLKCEESSDLKKTRDLLNDLEKSIKPLIQSLTWRDFELLVELIFSNSGWQKTTKTGGNQKTTDLDLKNPITEERIWVQVKSKSNSDTFKKYKAEHETRKGNFKTLYYVYHSGQIGDNLNEDDEEGIKVWDLEKVAKYVVSNGLTEWLMDKSK